MTCPEVHWKLGSRADLNIDTAALDAPIGRASRACEQNMTILKRTALLMHAFWRLVVHHHDEGWIGLSTLDRAGPSGGAFQSLQAICKLLDILIAIVVQCHVFCSSEGTVYENALSYDRAPTAQHAESLIWPWQSAFKVGREPLCVYMCVSA